MMPEPSGPRVGFWECRLSRIIVLPGVVEQGRPAVSVLDVLRARVV